MDLLERYLQTVGQHLPAKGKSDTLAELRENLLAQIEAREEELGRPLTEAEVATILEEHGRPMLVAMRYMPQQYLIGPGLFPIYWITMKKSLPLVVLAYAVVQAVALIFQGGSGFDPGAAIGHLPFVLLTFWAWITLAFAVFEFAHGRYFAEIKVSKRWNPFDMPPLAVPGKRQSRASGLADLIVHVLVIAWLLAIPYKPVLLLGPGLGYLRGLPVGLTPEWHIFYWQIIALLALMLPLKAASLYASLGKWRNGLQIAEQVLGVGILVVLIEARSYFVPTAALTTHSLGSLVALNSLIGLGFKIGLVIRIFKLFWDIWKMMTESSAPRAGIAMV
jgi:hypothetical protein